MPEGLCPYVHAMACWAEKDRSAAALVLTTLCDQMRRGAELIAETCGRQVFLLNLPTTWQGRAPVEMYISELLRLGRFLERMGGKKTSNEKLADTILEYSAARLAILSARSKMSARAFSQLTAEFPQGGLKVDSNFANDPQAKQDCRDEAVPLAIVGGPMLYEDLEVLDVVEQFGGRVVLDATDTGERAFPSPADEQNLQTDPLGELRGCISAASLTHSAGLIRNCTITFRASLPPVRSAGSYSAATHGAIHGMWSWPAFAAGLACRCST